MIGIINYGLGNPGSIINMLKKIGVEAVLTSDEEILRNADKLILPGVGAFDAGMHNLTEKALIPLLNQLVLGDKKPILGICLGMQLLGKSSEEGVLPGLGWIDFKNTRFNLNEDNPSFKIPHMGWNTIVPQADHSLLHNMNQDTRFYFVHSYHAVCRDVSNVLTKTEYGYSFASAVMQDNIYGVQFHPEKSHRFGMHLLKNFVECC